MSGKKNFSVLVGAAAAMLACSLDQANAAITLSADDKRQIRRCVSYMLLGPQYNGLELKGEGFNCKPVKATMAGETLVIKGQLSHQLTARPDDQVNFTMEFAMDGTLTKREVTIEDGGLVKVLKYVLGSEVGQAILSKIPYGLGPVIGGATDVAADKIAAKINAGWTGYSDLFLGGLQAQISQGLAEHSTSGVSSFFMDRPYGDIRSFRLETNRTYAGVKIIGDYRFSVVSACRALCRRATTCVSWTFTRTDNRCYLKNSTSGAISFHPEAVAGLR